MSVMLVAVFFIGGYVIEAFWSDPFARYGLIFMIGIIVAVGIVMYPRQY